jgi:hypothetical protein
MAKASNDLMTKFTMKWQMHAWSTAYSRGRSIRRW